MKCKWKIASNYIVDKLNEIYFEAGYQLAFLDIVSLFIN